MAKAIMLQPFTIASMSHSTTAQPSAREAVNCAPNPGDHGSILGGLASAVARVAGRWYRSMVTVL